MEAAVADKARPEADTKRDAARKPAEMLDFAGVKPGMVVGDFLPGGGYFTRIFAKAVGPKGKVLAITNPPPANAKAPPAINAIAADPQYGNITVVSTGIGAFKLPEPVDVFWTSQNYHDLYLTRFNLDVPAVTKEIYDAVKPGGAFIVLDHRAADGAPVVETANTLHRIDPASVRKTVEAAGFKFEGESKVLANPADDHTKGVFDPSIRGHTDQFIYKFRKPK
jgi:predicted methyltransferase